MKFCFRLTLMTILLLTTITMRAVDVQYLTIEVQGKPVSFALSDKPIISYQNNLLKLSTTKETIEFSVTDITSFRFEETSTSVRNLMSGDKPLVKGGIVYFSDLTPGNLVQVFSTDGRKVAETKIDTNGTAEVNISVFTKDTYIIKTEKHTIKYMNK